MFSSKIKIIIWVILFSIILIAIYFLFVREEKKEFIDLENSVVDTNPEKSTTATVKIGNREMVQIKFFWEVNGIRYNDALNLTKEQYEKLSPEEIEEMKQERFENWVKFVNNPPKEQI